MKFNQRATAALITHRGVTARCGSACEFRDVSPRSARNPDENGRGSLEVSGIVQILISQTGPFDLVHFKQKALWLVLTNRYLEFVPREVLRSGFTGGLFYLNRITCAT